MNATERAVAYLLLVGVTGLVSGALLGFTAADHICRCVTRLGQARERALHHI